MFTHSSWVANLVFLEFLLPQFQWNSFCSISMALLVLYSTLFFFVWQFQLSCSIVYFLSILRSQTLVINTLTWHIIQVAQGSIPPGQKMYSHCHNPSNLIQILIFSILDLIYYLVILILTFVYSLFQPCTHCQERQLPI